MNPTKGEQNESTSPAAMHNYKKLLVCRNAQTQTVDSAKLEMAAVK
jgi:hypothetical protein